MAIRIEREVYYEAQPGVEFETGQGEISSAESWVNEVIRQRDFPFVRGMGGVPGYYDGLDARVETKLDECLTRCGDSCHMSSKVSVTSDHEVSVKLGCGTLRDEDESVVDEREAACRENFTLSKFAISSFLVESNMTIAVAKKRLGELRTEVNAEEGKIKDLT